jgi:hypothetical protein
MAKDQKVKEPPPASVKETVREGGLRVDGAPEIKQQEEVPDGTGK